MRVLKGNDVVDRVADYLWPTVAHAGSSARIESTMTASSSSGCLSCEIASSDIFSPPTNRFSAAKEGVPADGSRHFAKLVGKPIGRFAFICPIWCRLVFIVRQTKFVTYFAEGTYGDRIALELGWNCI